MPQQNPVFSLDNGGVSCLVSIPLLCANDIQFDNYAGGNDMTFADPSQGLDVLQDFDFDSFLHQDDSVGDAFNFDTFQGLGDGNEVGAD